MIEILNTVRDNIVFFIYFSLHHNTKYVKVSNVILLIIIFDVAEHIHVRIRSYISKLYDNVNIYSFTNY